MTTDVSGKKAWIAWLKFWRRLNPKGANDDCTRYVRSDRQAPDPRAAPKSVRRVRQARPRSPVDGAAQLQSYQRRDGGTHRRTVSRDDASTHRRVGNRQRNLQGSDLARAHRLHVEMGG